MRKIIGFLAVLLIIINIAGCGNDEGQSENEAGSENQERETVEEEAKDNEADQEDSDQNLGNESDSQTDSEDENINEDTTEEEDSTSKEEIEPQYELTSNWSLKPLSDDGNEEVVLLTIDDAPDNNAVEMAKTLKKLDAKAIFFVNGHFLDTDEEKAALQDIHEMGFEIGNHTYNHQRLSEVSEEQQKEEIISLSDLVEEIIGERPKYFRAPNGVNTDFSKELVKEEGMLLMNWSYGYDWEADYQSKNAIADIMVNTEYLGNGSNLLMHDRDWTAEALPEIVNGLREKGYEILDPNLIKLPE